METVIYSYAPPKTFIYGRVNMTEGHSISARFTTVRSQNGRGAMKIFWCGHEGLFLTVMSQSSTESNKLHLYVMVTEGSHSMERSGTVP